MRFRQTYAVRAALALSSLVLVTPALQAKTRTAIYVTNRACQADGLLSAQECRNAFANAEAEFHDSVLVFDEQDECEKHFPRCVISFSENPDPKALRFSPMMKGVQVSVNSPQDRTVVPVLEGNHPAIRFGSRTVLNLQNFRSPLKQQDAQIRWMAHQRSLDLREAFTSASDQSAGPQLALMAPKLVEWCRRFCDSYPEPETTASTTMQSGSWIFAPRIDMGAQLHEVTSTHRFSRQEDPATRIQPGFVLSSGAYDMSVYGKTGIASLQVKS